MSESHDSTPLGFFIHNPLIMEGNDNNGGQPQGGQQGGEEGAPAPAPITVEEAAKMREQISNLNIALAADRNTIKSYKDAEAKKQQDDLVAKGEFEKVRTTLEQQLAEKDSNIEQLSKKVTTYEEHFINENNERLAKIPGPQKELFNELSAGKSPFEARSLFWKIEALGTRPPVGKDPNGKPTPVVDADKKAQIAAAKEKKDFTTVWNLSTKKQ